MVCEVGVWSVRYWFKVQCACIGGSSIGELGGYGANYKSRFAFAERVVCEVDCVACVTRFAHHVYNDAVYRLHNVSVPAVCA